MLKGLGGLANIGTLLKQAQEMGGRMEAIQAELRAKRASGSAGGGLIEVEVNGLGEMLALRIDPSLIEKGERELIEDLVPAAFRAAQQKAREIHAQAMQSLTGGVNLPGLQEALAQFTGGGSGEKP